MVDDVGNETEILDIVNGPKSFGMPTVNVTYVSPFNGETVTCKFEGTLPVNVKTA